MTGGHSHQCVFSSNWHTHLQESTDDPETKAGGKPGQKLDDDEDRKNPAYIPRKGLFFEHDVRGHAQEEERYTFLCVDLLHAFFELSLVAKAVKSLCPARIGQ